MALKMDMWIWKLLPRIFRIYHFAIRCLIMLSMNSLTEVMFFTVILQEKNIPLKKEKIKYLI